MFHHNQAVMLTCFPHTLHFRLNSSLVSNSYCYLSCSVLIVLIRHSLVATMQNDLARPSQESPMDTLGENASPVNNTCSYISHMNSENSPCIYCKISMPKIHLKRVMQCFAQNTGLPQWSVLGTRLNTDMNTSLNPQLLPQHRLAKNSRSDYR